MLSSKKIYRWRIFVLEEWIIYHYFLLFNSVNTHRMFLIENWLPIKEKKMKNNEKCPTTPKTTIHPQCEENPHMTLHAIYLPINHSIDWLIDLKSNRMTMYMVHSNHMSSSSKKKKKFFFWKQIKTKQKCRPTTIWSPTSQKKTFDFGIFVWFVVIR